MPPAAGGGGTSYLTSDHLGSTRVVTDGQGNVKARHDYLPFGEELGAGIGLRTVAMKYDAPDSTKQKFTQKERDSESGLDYFLARYYSSAQGRFTSPDEFTGGAVESFAAIASANATFYADIHEPQSLNKYQYCLNNPLRYVDPDGHREGPNVFDELGSEQEQSRQQVLTRGILGSTIHAGAVATQESAVRAAYNSQKPFADSQARRQAQLEMRKQSTPLGKALAEAHDLTSQPSLGGKTAEQAAASVQRTNPAFNTAGAISKVAGPVLLGVGVAMSVNNVATAPAGQRGETVAGEIGAWGGALAGGAAGAKAGGVIGTLFGPGYGTAIGAGAGGLLGGAAGGIAGSSAGKAVYNALPSASPNARAFDPLSAAW